MTPTERVRLAFDVASKLGVGRVFLDPCEVVHGRGGAPDRLSMMTYLHQLRICLTNTAASNKSATEKKEQVGTADADVNPSNGAISKWVPSL